MRPRVAGAGLALAGALLVSACTAQEAPPAPPAQQPASTVSTTPSATPRPERDFTIGTTDAITTVDPAAMTTGGSQALAFSVFQRLMTTSAGDDLLKPDAARDCIFEQATVYTCTLVEGLRFHSGTPVTSAEVKYSIERALRLDVPGSSTPQLASISQIQTPDPRTVRFVLAYPDTDIGHALASPAASIVDPQAYPADRVADAWTKPSGSGPYRHTTHAGGLWSFARYESYQGRTPARIVRVIVQEFGSSAELEQAMAEDRVDLAWRGLDEAAVTRQRRLAEVQADQSRYIPVVAPGARIVRLAWTPEAALAGDATVRTFVNQAVAPRRTLTSLLPVQLEAAQEGLYPAGGIPAVTAPPGAPIALTLGHDPRMPDGADLAADLARTIGATGQASVTVQAQEAGADLLLVDDPAATWTARAWLQDYTEIGTSPHAQAVARMLTSGLTSSDEDTRTAAAATIQQFAAEDAYVTPLAQSDEYLFIRRGFGVDLGVLGPGWQLGLAAFRTS